MSTQAEAKTKLNDPSTWEEARKLATQFGSMPSSFTSGVRALMADHQQNKTTLSPAAKFQVTRLVKSPAIKNPLLFALQAHDPQKWGDKHDASINDLIAAFSPFDLAGHIAVIFLFKHAKRLANAEEFQHLSKIICERAEVGAELGYAIPAIGPSAGLFVGALPHLAWVAYQRNHLKTFQGFRRQLKTRNVPFDFAGELERWECTSPQIASVLLQQMGFGIAISEGLARGIQATTEESNSLPEEHYRFYIAARWIENLLKSGKPPDMAHKGKFYPLKEDLAKLIERVEKVSEMAEDAFWLLKGKDDAPVAVEGGTTNGTAAQAPEISADSCDDEAENVAEAAEE